MSSRSSARLSALSALAPPDEPDRIEVAFLDGFKATTKRCITSGQFICPSRQCQRTPRFSSAHAKELQRHTLECDYSPPLSEADEALPDSAALLELDLVYDVKYHALICIPCGCAINAERAEAHWIDNSRRKHPKHSKSSLRALTKALGRTKPLDCAELARPPSNSPSIPYLPLEQGWRCLGCEKVFLTYGSLWSHYAAVHKDLPTIHSGLSGKRCQIQRWKKSRFNSDLFEVEAAQPSRPAAGSREISEPQQQQREEVQASQQQRSAQSSADSNTSNDPCRFVLTLQDGTYDKLAPLVDASRNSRMNAISETVLAVLEAGSSLLSSVPSFVKKRLARLDAKLDVSVAQFSIASADMLAKYADVWSRVMLFLVRAQEQFESEEEAQASGVLPAWKVLESFSAEQLASVADLSNENAASRQSAVLNLSRLFIEQACQDDGQASVVMVALACLCIRRSGSWAQPADIQPLIDALLYCSRLLSVLLQLEQFRLWDPATLALTQLHDDASATAHCWEAFEDRQKETLSRTSATVVPRLALLSSSLSKAAVTSGAEVQSRASGSASGSGSGSGSRSAVERPSRASNAAPANEAAQSSASGSSSSRVQREAPIEVDELDGSNGEPHASSSRRQVEKRPSTRSSDRARKRTKMEEDESDEDDWPVFVRLSAPT